MLQMQTAEIVANSFHVALWGHPGREIGSFGDIRKLAVSLYNVPRRDGKEHRLTCSGSKLC